MGDDRLSGAARDLGVVIVSDFTLSPDEVRRQLAMVEAEIVTGDYPSAQETLEYLSSLLRPFTEPQPPKDPQATVRRQEAVLELEHKLLHCQHADGSCLVSNQTAKEALKALRALQEGGKRENE